MPDDNQSAAKYELVNTLEKSVVQELRSIWKNHEGCTCEKCFYDVCALALNAIKPKYTTTKAGTIFARSQMLNQENLVEIQIKLAKALKMVAQSPKHEEIL